MTRSWNPLRDSAYRHCDHSVVSEVMLYSKESDSFIFPYDHSVVLIVALCSKESDCFFFLVNADGKYQCRNSLVAHRRRFVASSGIHACSAGAKWHGAGNKWLTSGILEIITGPFDGQPAPNAVQLRASEATAEAV